MQRRDKDVEALGICQRLFNFFMNSLIPRGLKRVTMGPRPLADHESNDIPVIHNVKPTSNNGEGSELHPDRSSSEIKIEFRHDNGLEHCAPTKDSPLVKEQKEGKREMPRGHEKLTPAAEAEDKIKVEHHKGILLDRIDEKSEEFIRQTRAAFIRNTSLDQGGGGEGGGGLRP